jgi:hypothetical protein
VIATTTREVELPVSGRTVTVRRPPVSVASLTLDFRTKYPRPRPPLQEVKIMGKVEWVENLAHPDLPAAVAEWQGQLNALVANAMLNFGVVSEPDDDDMVQVDQIRSMLGTLTSDMTDQEVFIKHVLIQADEDFGALTNAIMEMSVPTEGQIADNAARFRRAV